MKIRATTRNVLLYTGLFAGFVLFFMSFVISLKGAGGMNQYTIKNIIWGAQTMQIKNGVTGITTTVSIKEFFEEIEIRNMKSLGLNIMGFLGFLFLLLDVIAIGIISFVIKNKSLKKKIILILCVLFLLSAVFQLLIIPSEKSAVYNSIMKNDPIYVKYPNEVKEYVDSYFTSMNIELSAESIVVAILTILCGGLVATSQLIPEKE